MPRHRPVIQRRTGGTKSWKLNNQLLEDKKFKDRVEIILDHFEDECFDLDPTQAWDKTKKKVRNYAITRSIQLAKENKARLRGLYDRLSDPDINEDEKKQLENDIKTEHRKAQYGTYVRAKTELDFELENTRAYYKREKMQGQSNRIDEVTTENGTETDENTIKTSVKDFYQTLYTRETLEEADMDHYCDVNIEPRDIDPVKTFLTVADIQNSIKESNNNKSPGPDGLTYEFYKHFSKLVTPILERVYLMVYTQGKMPISMCNSHVRLIYKNKGERADLKNWRPISLSNTDYKIMTRCLAREMSKTLKEIVGENQVCGIPGRTIIDHLYTLYDMNDDGRTNNINMLAIDFEKAFDRVDHRYILKVMEKMGFKQNDVRWAQIITSNITAQVMVNGDLTDMINIKRGIRQGCSYSMLLFLISLEPLIDALNNDNGIPPIRVAHDTTINSPGLLDMYPQLNRVRLKISALTNFDMGNNILKVPRCPMLGFCINCH